jgi:membrane-associated phospholipid phosphatase
LKPFFLILIILLPSSKGFCQNPDINILRNINENRNRNLDNTFYYLTTTTTEVCIVEPVSLLAAGFIKHDKALKIKGATGAGAIIAESLIGSVIKYSVHRPRPFVTYLDIEKIGPAGSPSFPSGHTGAAFCTATSISLAFPKWYVIAPAYLWASAVAYSRMDLGAHYPSDVAAGILIGTGCAWLSYKIQKRLNN